MRSAIILLLIITAFTANAQTPFTSYKTTKLLTSRSTNLTENEQRTFKINARNVADLPNAVDSIHGKNNAVKDSLQLEYFDHLSANAVFIQNSQKMFPTINGEIVHYRLSVWSHRIFKTKPSCPDCNALPDRIERRKCREMRPKCLDSAAERIREHYLPFSVITKISSDYLDSSAGPTHDATSFYGAPLTLRFSPAADLTPYMERNKLFLGLNTDLRLLTYTDTISNNLQTAWGAYASLGLTYLGKGYAFESDGADRHDGWFSASAMLYWFKSGGQFNQALFGNYEKKTLTGVEFIFRFKASSRDDSKFNFIFGANNGFTRGAPNFAKWQFQLGIGT